MSIFCKFTNNGFFFNKGNVANCCAQGELFAKTNWDDVSDLNEFYKNNSFLKSTRESLKNDIQHPVCKTCWLDENLYHHSMRTNNPYFDKTEDDGIVDITHVDLRLSSRCNLQCRMCSPYDSDQLAALADRLHAENVDTPLAKIRADSTPIDNRRLLDLIVKLPNLKAIKFAGGEPFIMPEVEEFLRKLADIGKTDLHVELITNCTSAKKSMIELLKMFRRVNLACSIDSVEEVIEYQRFPVKWATVEKNFTALYNSGFYDVGIHPCIGLLNFHAIDRLFDWSKQYPNTWVGYNEIYEPSFLNFRYIPLDVRKDLHERFLKIDLDGHDVKWHQFRKQTMYEYIEPSQEDCNMLYEYTHKVWDKQGKRKFLDIYPWAKYMIDRADKK